MTDLVHAVQFLQTAYTILLALAFGEAFKQFVPDGDKDIRWDRLPSLLAFLFMIFPFFHGMSRFFYITYLHQPGGELATVAGFLMFDGMMFLVMAAIFFVLSRSLSLNHWSRFYIALLVLLTVDSVWIGVSLYRGADVLPWLILNVILAALLVIVLICWRNDKPYDEINSPPCLPSWICAIAIFGTTVADYIWMHKFYFP
jgi:hypothetical protein